MSTRRECMSAYRQPRNMPMFCAAVCRMVPMIITRDRKRSDSVFLESKTFEHLRQAPMNMVILLPYRSEKKGANGRPAIPPIDWMALKIPKSEPVGLPKEACQVSRVLEMSPCQLRKIRNRGEQNSLEAVHHGAVITIVGGSDEKK